MKCDICGYEYEGIFCPNCGWEEMNILDDEYLEIFNKRKEIYKNKIKFCSHCGKPFIPRSPNQKFCHRKLCDRDRQLLKKKNFKRKPRWKEEEVKLLWETFGLKGFSKEKAEELSQKLGRSVTAIKEKYRELRRATQCV